jgi:serine/threonine-protein kinase
VPVTPERWQHIARIYELAVDQDPATRDTFLSEACACDEALRHDVESLLREDDASVVLDRSVWTLAASLFDEHLKLATGTLLGPYRIDGALGAGGMGEVFSATDTRLNRRVALKVLPTAVALDEQMRIRFAREARAVAALMHAHICTLYDVGRHEDVDFLVMEHLEGETLATRLVGGQLPLDMSLTYAIQIASALDHAHCQGIVHRDLKPANIMLTATGAKLLDFGIAKLRNASGETASADVRRAGTIWNPTVLTSAHSTDMDDVPPTCRGAILGTLRYMAPEQITGHAVDARSDLFSFGTVLYEMLTGKRAFEGDSAASIRVAILEREPPSVSSLNLSVPRTLDELIVRCLAKNPDERWRTADELLHELKRVAESSARTRIRSREVRRWIAAMLITGTAALGAWLWTGGLQRSSAPPATRIRAIAVLPLEDLSRNDTDHTYVADGMTEQLITDLATISGLRVISRTSVMHYKTSRKPVPEVAQELQVDGVIEGSVVLADDTVRITAKLIEGVSGDVLWARSFEGDVRNVLALQHEVARAISSRVGITLTAQEQARLRSARPVDPEVHRQVLLGSYHANKRTEEGLQSAVSFFKAANRTDPGYAPAHAALAAAYTELSGFYLDPRQAMPQARRAAETAIQLDETLAEAHAALGYVHLAFDWDGPAAERSLLRALDLNPTLVTARLNYAAYLTTQKRHDDAVREIRRAVNLDPLSIHTHTFGATLLNFTRRYDEAIELARHGLELEPDSGLTIAIQGVAHAEQRRFQEALDSLERAARLDSSLTILALQARVLAVAGRKAEAVETLRRIEDAARSSYFRSCKLATVYVDLGDLDTAAALFRKGIDERADCMPWLGVEPWIDPFRADSRYLTLLRDIGLAPEVR